MEAQHFREVIGLSNINRIKAIMNESYIKINDLIIVKQLGQRVNLQSRKL